MIYTYKLKTTLGRLARRLKLRLAVRQVDGDFLYFNGQNCQDLNWGISNSNLLPENCLNRNIKNAVSKVKAFELFAANNLPHPRYDSTLEGLRNIIGMERTILSRIDKLSGGRGIHIIGAGQAYFEEAHDADFYVEKLSITREARIHVFNGEAKLFQVKLLPIGNTNPIHSHLNGITYSTKFEKYLQPNVVNQMTDYAVQAITALGLDFGAVDLVLTRHGRIYILEANTAPGIKSSATIETYKNILDSIKL